MGSHYTLENLRRALDDPWWFREEVRRINRGLNRRLVRPRYGQGFDVMEADWDTLIIFDGCRYDVFAEKSRFYGDSARIVSQGGHSNEFMQKTFQGRKLHDTVYVTSNPWSEELSDDVFFLTRRTYTADHRGGTARLPEDVAKLAIETFDEYPDKRYIVHFMQPNNPYVGPKARAYRTELLETQGVLCTEMDTPGSSNVTNITDEVQHLRRALRRGYISREVMLDVYRENLEIVTEHAARVIESLGGRTAITADHGDMFGERLAPLCVKEYSHWEGVYSDALRHVPWVIMESANRRTHRAESPMGRETMDTDSLRKHLQSMGYLSR